MPCTLEFLHLLSLLFRHATHWKDRLHISFTGSFEHCFPGGQESFDELLQLSEPLVTMGEVALRAMEVPEGEYEVQYVNGVRQMVTKI